jgi:hypothetical protein
MTTVTELDIDASLIVPALSNETMTERTPGRLTQLLVSDRTVAELSFTLAIK